MERPIDQTNNKTMSEPTENQKKLAAGVCCFNLVGLVSMAGFICSVYAFAYCDFLAREVELSPTYADGSDSQYENACVGLGYTSYSPICETLLQPHKIGFTYWQGTVPVDQRVCFSYTQLTPWGYVTAERDSYFTAASWMSSFGYVFGAFGWFTVAFANCCRIDQSRLMGTSCTFLLASLFTGLSLLMFQSNACEPGFFAPYFVRPSDLNDPDKIAQFQEIVTGVSCSLSLGSNMAISACVLYFVSALMIPCSIVPAYANQQAWAEQQNAGDPVVVQGQDVENKA